MTVLAVDGLDLLDEPELVLFDKDGTLIDIHHYWTNMVQFRADIVIEQCFPGLSAMDGVRRTLVDVMGVDLSSGRMKPNGPVGVKPRNFIVKVVTDTVRDMGVDIDEVMMEALFAEIDRRTSANMLPLLRLLPGVVDLLATLNAKGIAAAVVSTDITCRVTATMQSLGIDQYFKTIIGGNGVANTKPAPDLALAALAYCGANPKLTAVIGDHPVDIQMGKSAGCALNIGVLNGLSTATAFADMKCTLIQDLTHITVI